MKKEKTDGLNFEGEEKPTKKPYHSPQLTVYGTVEQITGAAGLFSIDGFGDSILLP
jgi:hypothetical protein